MDLNQMAGQARLAALQLAGIDSQIKNTALAAVRKALESHKEAIFTANREDLHRAEAAGVAVPLIKRLKFDDNKLAEALKGLDDLISFPDPVGRTLAARELDEGLELYKVSCPIGVIGVIFESRPDALVQISALCLKSGNALLLKGGSEAARTNRQLADVILGASLSAGMPAGWLGLLETRQDVNAMLACDKSINLIIPRGSNEFVRYIMDNTNIPVMGHADGICHVYVDNRADPEMALTIVTDAKCQYVAVCNALETLLVHREIAPVFLPRLYTVMQRKGVELRGCPATKAFIDVIPAADADWKTEYLDYILSIKTVEEMNQAIDHINTYGSGHTDAIVTSHPGKAARFLNAVDSANVFYNCSTRFADGYRYGLGAEVGISTSRIHARGPMGIEGLLIYKWKLIGKGQVVADYTGPGSRPFTHRELAKEFKI